MIIIRFIVSLLLSALYIYNLKIEFAYLYTNHNEVICDSVESIVSAGGVPQRLELIIDNTRSH